jgi:hypothetical protein
MNYESPYTIWWDENIQGKYGVGFEVRQLMAMAFEGGRKSMQLRELTDEEIMQTLNGIEYSPAEVETSFDYEIRIARAIESYLKGEKFCNKCNNTGWVCEWHPNKEAHKCCGGAGMPCECIKESE